MIHKNTIHSYSKLKSIFKILEQLKRLKKSALYLYINLFIGSPPDGRAADHDRSGDISPAAELHL